MFIRNNPDIDFDDLEARVDRVLREAEHARSPAPPPLFETAPGARPAAPAAPVPEASVLGRLRRRRGVGAAIEWGLAVLRLHRLKIGVVALLRRQGEVDGQLRDLGEARTRLEQRMDRQEIRQTHAERAHASVQDQLGQHHHHLTGLTEEVREAVTRLEGHLSALRTELERYRGENAVLRQALTRLSTEAPRPSETVVPSAPAPAEQPAADGSMADDLLYQALEDRFRGSPDAIADRLREHLPALRACAPVTAGAPVLDIGCGRGEWLSVLRDAGITGRGVDLNAGAVERCRVQGLDVAHQDALGALRDQADDTLGAITAFHIIEHLPFEVVTALLREASRVLAPGGVIMLETPNPENLSVGAHTFYMDPTHRHPLPPALTAFLAEHAGFWPVRVDRLHPLEAEHHVHEDSETTRRLNGVLYGPQDYMVLAVKPGAPEDTDGA